MYNVNIMQSWMRVYKSSLNYICSSYVNIQLFQHKTNEGKTFMALVTGDIDMFFYSVEKNV